MDYKMVLCFFKKVLSFSAKSTIILFEKYYRFGRKVLSFSVKANIELK